MGDTLIPSHGTVSHLPRSLTVAHTRNVRIRYETRVFATGYGLSPLPPSPTPGLRDLSRGGAEGRENRISPARLRRGRESCDRSRASSRGNTRASCVVTMKG